MKNSRRTGFGHHWLLMLLAAALTFTGCDVDDGDALGGDSENSADGGGAGGGGGAGAAGGAGGQGGYGGANAADAGASWNGGQGGEGGAGGGGVEPPPMGNTNISLGGAQDFGYFRRLLDNNQVPTTDDFEAAGFFAEHHTVLPTPDCGERVCAQAMLGVLGNLINGNNCTMLQIGLNSPLIADPGLRPPLNLTVVVDVSGSMREAGKLEFVQAGLEQMVLELHDEDQISIVSYSSTARVELVMTAIRGNRNDILSIIRRLSPSGATNLFDGLQQGYREALDTYDSGKQNRVILLSDGQPTRGIVDSEEILEMSSAYNSEGIGLTAVGLGTDFNYELMAGLAQRGDGNYYFVEDAGAVEEVFTEELSYFTVPVAFDLELELTAGSDYRFVRAVGSPFFETTRTGGSLDVPSVFLAHRVAHDDVGPGGGRRGGGSALLIELMPIEDPDREPGEARVANITARFREPGSDRIVEQVVDVRYPELPWIVRNQGFFDNKIVEKSFVMFNIYAALAGAVDQFHFENDPEGAVDTLVRLIAAVADYEDSANDGEGDEDMVADIELMRQLVQVIEANSWTPPEEWDEPDVDDDPWPCD